MRDVNGLVVRVLHLVVLLKFQVAGTIVTYELVLYQLNDGGEKAKAAPTCPAMNAQNWMHWIEDADFVIW